MTQLLDDFSSKPALAIQDFFIAQVVAESPIYLDMGDRTVQVLAAERWARAGKPIHLKIDSQIPPNTYQELHRIQDSLRDGHISPSQANERIGRLPLY